jgi:hypothetical protein
MAFSYSTSLSSYKDRIRFLSGDTTETSDSFSDEELAALESFEPNLFLGAAQVAEQIGLKVAKRAYKYDTASDTRGGLLVDRSRQPEWWFKRAKTLRERATEAAMNADELIERFAFDVDAYGSDVSEYIGTVVDY